MSERASTADLLRESAAIVAQLDAPEGMDADELDARLAAWLDAHEDRLAAYRWVLARLDAEDAIHAALIARVTATRRYLDRQREVIVERATALLVEQERLTGEARVKRPDYSAWLVTTESVDVTAPAAELPEQYQRVNVEPARALIGAALRAGTEVPGCVIRTTRRVRFR